MTNRLHQVLYVSSCAETLGDHAVRDILAKARAHNAAHSITGVLIYSGAHFAQVLEGPGPEVEALMASIRLDARHGNLRTLLSAPVARRRFDGWSMGFAHDLSLADLLAELSSTTVDASRAARLVELLFQRAALHSLS